MLNTVDPQWENKANEFKGAVADFENLNQKIVHRYNDCNMSDLKFSDKEKTNCKTFRSNISNVSCLSATIKKTKQRIFAAKFVIHLFKKI